MQSSLMCRACLLEQGASTLTQQLARNLYLTHERTWQRKLKEAVYTAQLEMNYSKDEILGMYLNQIYYGHGSYGIEAAAEMYFGKHASDLTLAESAMLAGIPKGPKYYSPYLNMKNAKDRQYTILQAMLEGDHYNEQADAAYTEVADFPAAWHELSRKASHPTSVIIFAISLSISLGSMSSC